MSEQRPSVFARIKPLPKESNSLNVASNCVDVNCLNISFPFNGVLENATQEATYKAVVPTVEEALSWRNATILTYASLMCGVTARCHGKMPLACCCDSETDNLHLVAAVQNLQTNGMATCMCQA
jgi:hypothetical protein